MKLVPWLLLGIVLVAAAWTFGLGLSSPRARIVPEGLPEPVETPAPSEPRAARPPTTVAPPEVDAERQAVEREAAAETDESAPQACRVFGRVIDEQGTVLQDVPVVLLAVDEPWAEGVVLPQATFRGHSTRAYSVSTGADGHFRLETPVPTSDWISLHVEPDSFHALLSRDFGPAGGRDKARLQPGDNDLGDLVLAVTGEARGVVLARQGGPVGGARVRLEGSFPGGLVVSAECGEDGSFVLGHLPPGTCRIQAAEEGWQSALSGSVHIRARQTTSVPSLILDPAPTISGVVVDESGTPVPDVRLWAWPVSSGQGAGARSGADGSFTMFLPQDEPYRFDFSHPGYEPHKAYLEEPVSPGTRDVRLVLRRGRSVTFLVVDAETGAPVERYGLALNVLEHGSTSFMVETDPVRQADHPGGECRVMWKEGKVIARVEADGYALAAPDLETPAGGSQTVRLVRGESVSGRVLRDGEALAGVRVEIGRTSVKRDPRLPDEAPEDRWFSSNYRFDLSPFVGRLRRVSTGEDGRFRIEHLAAGTYAVLASGPGTAPLVRDPVVVGAEPVVLGDLALEPGAAIHGRILVPPGRSARDWRLLLKGPTPSRGEELEADGRFDYDGLQPGHYEIQAQPPASGRFVTVRELELASGETAQVEVDVSFLVPATVSVLVLRDGTPLEGVRVRCSCPETGQQGALTAPTDAEGLTSGETPPCVPLEVMVVSEEGVTIGQSVVEGGAPPGSRIEVRVDLVLGTARLVFPEGFEVPDRGLAFLSLRKGDQGPMNIRIATPGLPMPFGGSSTWEDRVVELGLMAPGEYEVRGNVQRVVRRELAGQSTDVFQSYAVVHGRLVVRRGAEGVCQLELKE